jgi:hypothetical protein
VSGQIKSIVQSLFNDPESVLAPDCGVFKFEGWNAPQAQCKKSFSVLLCNAAPMLLIALTCQDVVGGLPMKATSLYDDFEMCICASIQTL